MSSKQSKKHRREDKDVTDLEELLKSNIDEYAQACWTLANTKGYTAKAGAVIDFGGPCKEHGSHTYRFRLTHQSMMAIGQCVGMETCGEAVDLVHRG